MNNELKLTTSSMQAEIKTEEEPQVLEEIAIEELSIDGICGVY